jgi:hypothetical protein
MRTENPYFQYFCGEVVFRHELPFDRSSLTRWRQRLGEEQIAALLQESLSVAHRTEAIDTKDLERVAIDTTVQEKAIAHPTDARLTHRAIEKLVELAKREGVELARAICAYNFSLLLRWFEELLRVLSLILWHALLAASLHLTRCRKPFFTAETKEVK